MITFPVNYYKIENYCIFFLYRVKNRGRSSMKQGHCYGCNEEELKHFCYHKI